MNEKVVRVVAVKRKSISESYIKKLKVAGYARVSTENEEQESSYKTQVEYYANLIKKNSAWKFVGMYSDEGTSGVTTKGRNSFSKMIHDAKCKKIDLIITKSISRFARNTVDALSVIRELKDCGVEVYFEKENIKTLDAKGELMLSIMSSLAQEESRSISENVQWGIRKRFSQGHARIRLTNFFGYKKNDDGNVVIDNDGAVVVRKIFKMFLSGKNYAEICRLLMKEHVKTAKGCERWRIHVVKSILTNEKYCGDALCQKYYTVDYMKKRIKKNDGKVLQYYIENNHEAIISRKVFDRVQRKISRRTR